MVWAAVVATSSPRSRASSSTMWARYIGSLRRCEGCGFTEFYVVNPSLLGQAIDAAEPTDAFKQKQLPFRVSKDAN